MNAGNMSFLVYASGYYGFSLYHWRNSPPAIGQCLRLQTIATKRIGVANVAVWGEKDPQLQIIVNPDRLRAHRITVDMVLQAARDATAVGSGGFIDTANQRIAIRNVPPVYSPEQLGQTVNR
jgi:multidrug efflux pump subunit AcrB